MKRHAGQLLFFFFFFFVVYPSIFLESQVADSYSDFLLFVFATITWKFQPLRWQTAVSQFLTFLLFACLL